MQSHRAQCFFLTAHALEFTLRNRRAAGSCLVLNSAPGWHEAERISFTYNRREAMEESCYNNRREAMEESCYNISPTT